MKQFNKTKLWENMIQSNPHNNGFLTASVWVFSVFRELFLLYFHSKLQLQAGVLRVLK